MKKLAALALISSLALAAPVFAADSGDISSDAHAVYKDNKAMAKDKAAIAQDRAAKAKADAQGDVGGQIVNGASIGADYVVKGEKETETAVDKKLMRNDVNNYNGK